MARNNQSANGDQQYPAQHLDGVKVALEAAIKNQKPIYCQRGEQEWNSQPQGVHPKQEHTLHKSDIQRRQSEDGAENRADAGRPSKSERKSNDKRANG